ncbi:MAG: acyltransferase family protein [Candidatus Amulumruptor caecigallinarius]|nr:acyltransferase family protein [Candidatus Amulumruptor caecigallinarius]MCM1396587.1 acyltransferase family protein [Candidatus Amulumruptor caecigallinarius]MCM1453355.1 acyltransferase family protein [bacterium]
MPHSTILSIGLTALVPLCVIIILLWRNTIDTSEGGFFFSKEYTNTLKGICAIIVIFVHFPPGMGNPLQDAIGSFAYVAVTFFFMFSAFGMNYSLDHNDRYLRTFWRGRLSALIIPNLVINALAFLFRFISEGTVPPLSHLFTIYGYVVALLEYCVVFYLLALVYRRRWISRRLFDVALVVIVTLASVVLWTVSKADSKYIIAISKWPYEMMGLAWGVILYRNFTHVKRWLADRRRLKSAIALACCVALGVAYLRFKQGGFAGGYLLKEALGLSIITLVFLTTYRRRITNVFTRFLGGISYEMYLSHGVVMQMVVYTFSDVSSGVAILLTMTGVIIFSWLAHSISAPLVKRLRKPRLT